MKTNHKNQDEYLDIVDENDNVIGRDIREKIYAKNLGHSVRVINIFVFNSAGKLLLPKKVENSKYFPGCFDFSCGGHVESGEDYDYAAVRELEEELGIKDEELTELGKLTPKDGVSCFIKVYKLVYNEKIENYDRNNIEKICWFDLKEVKQLIAKNRTIFKDDFPIVLNWYIKNLRR